MGSKLSQLLDQMKRFNTINQEDIPVLIKEIEELQASAQLYYLQLEKAWEQLDNLGE